ncbi:YlxR family protein [Chloroflexota bacterium]
MTKRPYTNKHIPLRTCVACREIKNKREMVRLVNSASSGVQVDSIGRQLGRGAYLCRLPECWQTGLAGNRLEYTLRTKITSENRARLAEYGRSLNGGC